MPPLAVLVALADPTRCRIIEILHQGAQPVHGLAGHFNISRPAISRHLRVLKQARLISEKKIGRENRYTLHAGRLKPLGDWLSTLSLPERSAEARPPLTLSTRAKLPKKGAAVTASSPPETARPPLPSASQMGFDF